MLRKRRGGYVNSLLADNTTMWTQKELLVAFDLTRCQLDKRATLHGANFSPKGSEQDAYVLLFPLLGMFVLGGSSTHSLTSCHCAHPILRNHSLVPHNEHYMHDLQYIILSSLETVELWNAVVFELNWCEKKKHRRNKEYGRECKERKGKGKKGRKEGGRYEWVDAINACSCIVVGSCLVPFFFFGLFVCFSHCSHCSSFTLFRHPFHRFISFTIHLNLHSLRKYNTPLWPFYFDLLYRASSS